MPTRRAALALAGSALVSLPIVLWAATGSSQETLPWQRGADPRYQQRDETYRPEYDRDRYEDPNSSQPRRRAGDAYDGTRRDDGYAPRAGAPTYTGPDQPTDRAYRPPSRYGNPGQPGPDDAYRPPRGQTGQNDAYGPPRSGYPAQGRDAYNQPSSAPPAADRYGQPYPTPPGQRYGQPYSQPYTPPGQAYDDEPADRGYGPQGADRRYGPRHNDEVAEDGFSSREILDTGHRFFGSVSKGLASVVEYAFQKQGRPNGYILGQDAGGALIAGLRYGEGTLYTKDAGTHRIYWQGPSIGYDAGVEGSKVMMLVYHLRDPEEIYQRFPGVDGSAYFIGGVGVTFQQSGNVIVAPIRSGVGLRLGANVGYLKYTRRPTWNPF